MRGIGIIRSGSGLWCPMPEIFLEFIGDASPWLLPLLVVLAVWGKFNWAALNNPDKKASFERAVGWLREDSFGQLYLGFLGGLMDRVGDWIGDRQRLSQSSMTAVPSKGLMQRMFGFNPFTAESYEKCLSLALMYPFLSFLLAWTAGSSGKITTIDWLELGKNQVENNERSLWGTSIILTIFLYKWILNFDEKSKKILFLITLLIGFGYELLKPDFAGNLLLFFFLCFLFLFLTLYLGGWFCAFLINRSVRLAHQETYNLSILFAFTFAFFFVSTAGSAALLENIGYGNVVIMVSGMTAGAISLSATNISIFIIPIVLAISVGTDNPSDMLKYIFLGAFLCSGFIMIFLKNIQKWSFKSGNIAFFWCGLPLFFILISISSLILVSKPTYMLVILFWLLLPLVNAPLDWLSLGFTRGLLQAVCTGNHSGYRTLIWAGVDLLLAFIFMLLITAVLVGVIALGNAIAGKTLVEIGCILSNLQNDMSHPDHWWIYFMLLSTLIPTLFHFALAGGAATLWLPRKWRTQLADGLEEDTHKTFGAWAYLTLTPVVGFVLMPLALLWSLWWLLNTNSGALGTLLLNWATGLAQWADPAMMLSCSAG